MRFVWDEAERATNLLPEPQGHGLDFAAVQDGFDFDTAVVAPSYARRGGAPRFLAVGLLDGRLCALVLSPLDAEAASVISLQAASRKERRLYEQART